MKEEKVAEERKEPKSLIRSTVNRDMTAERESEERKEEENAVDNTKMEEIVSEVRKYQIRERSANDFFICLQKISRTE